MDDINELLLALERLERKMDALSSLIDERLTHTAHKLRDDKDFIKPFWHAGADHMGERAVNRIGVWLFWIVVGSFGSVTLIWLGRTGVLFK